MTTDPMLDAAGTLSINRFTGDGTRTSWDINFAGGYMQAADVKAYTTDALGVNTVRTVAWVGANTVSITPAVAAGIVLTVYRDTPKNAPVVDFTDGAIVNELNLDKLAKQAVFTSAEMVDRFAVVNDKADTAVDTATLAKTRADIAISNTALITGGDFTKFGRTDVAATWTANQNFTGGLQIAGLAVATQAYVTAAIAAISFASYSTTSQMNTAISNAIAPLATSASVTAVAGTVTTETNRAKSMEGFLLCLALR